MARFILTPNHTEKQGQIWGFDLIIAVIIFLIGIVAIYVYVINFVSTSGDILESMFYDGYLLSNLILSEGSPKNWTSYDNVEIPGILSQKKINQTKLDFFYNLTDSEEDYKKLKKLLGIRYDFYFYFPGIRVMGEDIDGIGKIPAEQKNLVRIERFMIYENKPVKLTLYVWN